MGSKIVMTDFLICFICCLLFIIKLNVSDPAEILHTRFNDQEHYFEYYVHYEGYNRRLDQWVRRDR